MAMLLTESEELFIIRKRKRIKLSQIAKFADCSISLLSRFENKQVAMNKEKVRKYREYVEMY